MRKCIKTRFLPIQTLKNNFLTDFNHSRGEQNNFLGLDSGGLEVCANALKHVLNHSRQKKNFFEWLDSGGLEMHKNTFLTTPDVKK